MWIVGISAKDQTAPLHFNPQTPKTFEFILLSYMFLVIGG
jgi:hypothetical protein